jgi:transcriptional regulator with XRE-family HTH domain
MTPESIAFPRSFATVCGWSTYSQAQEPLGVHLVDIPDSRLQHGDCETRMIQADQIRKGFGDLLRRRRLAAGLSQKSFAKAVGLSRTSVTNIESGRQPVSLPSLYVMADVLQIEVSELLPSVRPRTATRPRVVSRFRNVTSKESDWLSKIAARRANDKH